jgi:acetyl-CoA carboxylase alpha subunit
MKTEISVWLIFFGTAALVLLCVEIGFRLGRAAHRRFKDEMESPAAAMGGAILGLVAFMLAFTFGIASSRVDLRKELIRDEANAIETTYLRADFLEQPDREEVKRLLVRYLDQRLSIAGARTLEEAEAIVGRTGEIHDRLWMIAVEHAQRELNSDVALDRPTTSGFRLSQQPRIDVRSRMGPDSE